MRALIIDDSQFIQRLVQGVLLGSCKFEEVVNCPDGISGLKAITEARKEYDLIILDWNMPGMDGIDVLLETRNAGITTPILMCTSEGNRESIINAISAGANEYLVKPFNNATLEYKVNQLMSKTAYRRKSKLYGHIMVVDDSAFVRKMIEKTLLQAEPGMTFHHADDGKMALTLYERYCRQKFDLILLDWEMPGLDGIEVLREIRKRDTMTPIIMISGKADVHQKVAAFDAGVTNFISKPFKDEDLLDKVQQVLMW